MHINFPCGMHQRASNARQHVSNSWPQRWEPVTLTTYSHRGPISWGSQTGMDSKNKFHAFACFIELWMHPVWHWKSKKEKKHLLHNRILTNDKHAFFSWLKITFYNFVRKPLHVFIAREKDTDCSRDKLSSIFHLIRTRKSPFNLRLSLRTSPFKMSRVPGINWVPFYI